MHQKLHASKDAHAAPLRRDILSFLIHEQRFGLPIDLIREIVVAQKITPLPRQSPGTLGLIHLRRKNIPVLNLSHLMGLPHVDSRSGLMIIVETEHGVFSICATAVEQIHHIQAGDFSANADGMVLEIAQIQDEILPILHIERLTRAVPPFHS